jgi:hypothetical protein
MVRQPSSITLATPCASLFQTTGPQIDNFMHPRLNLNGVQDMSTQLAPDSSKVPARMYELSHNMQANAQHMNSFSTMSSGTTTPTSIRSSLSNESSISSRSSASIPNRSSMKSNLKSKPSTEISINRISSPPTVRFAEPEPTAMSKPATGEAQHTNYSRPNVTSNTTLQNHRRPPLSLSNPASSRYSAGPQAYSTLPRHSVATPQLGQMQYRKPRLSQRYSAPVQSSQPGSRRSIIRSSQNFTPPSLALEHRVSSFHSVASDFSVQSAPATLQTFPITSPPGQYNPLEHYIPCLHATCTTHFSSASSGPTYHLPEGPYSLSKHHAYCPQHASSELKEANAWCKRNYEALRQNAGRKTLGQIATEFDEFLETFRQERRLENAELKRRLRRVILGASASSSTAQNKGKQIADMEWDWKYTPRYCTRAECRSAPYSPFASHLYAFYHTARSSTFVPLATCCPSCAKTEVEAFEQMVAEKWSSRCGWDDAEWTAWFGSAIKDRELEREFWDKAQERVTREKGPSSWVDGKSVEQESGGVGKEKKPVEKRKSVFKRLFGSVTKNE